MTDPRAAALTFEAVKIAMRQTKEGHALTLVIHPDDIPDQIFKDPVGSRYQVALVRMDDENQPVMPEGRAEGEKAVQQAGLLAREKKFQHYMVEQGYALEETEAAAIEAIHEACHIKSRAELRINGSARQIFIALTKEFERSMVNSGRS